MRMSSARTRLFALSIILLGVANHAPSLGWGFQYDDYMHQFMIRFAGDEPSGRPWNLYDFASASDPDSDLRGRGLLPWWASDDFQIRYFRPITSLSILADAALYGRWAPGYHATSLVLFGLFLFLTFELYVALGASASAALWALAVLSFDDVHALPVGWLAARSTPMAALFVVATLLAVIRHERSRKPIDLGIALLCFLLACGCKEDSAMIVPVVALYVLLLTRPSGPESWVKGCARVLRSKAIWALALVAASYGALYAASGYGTNSAMHLTPWDAPGRFALRLATMIPLNLTTLFFGLPGGDLAFTRPELEPLLVGLGVLGVGLLAVIYRRRAFPRPLAGFALGFSLLTMIPASVVATSDRLLTVASVGTALIIGLVMHEIGSAKSLLANRRREALATWGLFVVASFVLALPMLHVRGQMFAAMASRDREAIVRADLEGSDPRVSDVVLVNSPSSLLGLFASPIAGVVHDDPDLRVYPLQLGRRSMTWHRESDDALVVTYGAPPLLDHRFELLVRSHGDSPEPGARFETKAFSATVLEVEGSGIRKVRFTSARGFDDPSYRFLAWREGRFERTLPPSVGEGPMTLGEPEPTVSYAP
jgi:hypothetical protein